MGTEADTAASAPYPEHLRACLADLPQAPGVYLFLGESDGLPLYIGKSVNIRQRVLSHMRAADEARLMRQTRRIQHIRTAGEVGALLLESQLIKARQPLFNQRLRRTRQLCAWRWQGGNLELVDARQVQFGTTPGLFGLFASRHHAQQALIDLAADHRLCLSVLGLERPTRGKPCFRYQIQRCAGACCGAESLAAHQHRLEQALSAMQVMRWPFPAGIALTETCPVDPRFVQHHVVRDWCYLGTTADPAGASRLNRTATAFDADVYKILCKPILDGSLPVLPLV